MEMANLKRKIFSFFIITIVSVCHNFLFAAEYSKLIQKKSIISILNKNGFDCMELNLSTASENFCPNLFLSFSPSESENTAISFSNKSASENESKKAKANQDELYIEEKELLLCFSQDFFLKYNEMLIKYFSFLRNSTFPYKTSILLYTEPEENLLPYSKTAVNSLNYYEDTIYETENLVAIIVNDQDFSGNYLFVSSDSGISPSWLTRLVKKACKKSSKDIIFPSSFIFLHNQKLTPSNINLNAFLEDSIPSINIGLSGESEDLEVLKNISTNFYQEYSKNWIKHYSFIKTPAGDIWTEEFFYIGFYILAVAISLFYLCFMPMSASIKNKALLKDFYRIWYTIPLTILITGILFFGFQKIFLFTKNIPTLHFSLKFFTAFIISLFLLSLQLIFNFKFSYSETRYEMLLASTINIVIFGCMNISYIVIFIIEYILIVIFIKSNSKYVNCLLLCLLCMPFAYLLSNIQLFSDSEKLKLFANNSFLKNIAIAFMIYPIQIQWLRTALLFHAIDNENKKLTGKKILSVSTAIILFVIIILGFYALALLIYKPDVKKINTSDKNTLVIKEDEISAFSNSKISTDEITVHLTQSKYFDLSTNNIILKGKKDILRYEISIESEKSPPILECNYSYSLTSKNSCTLIMPDFPTDDLEIVYTADDKSKRNICITTYFFEMTSDSSDAKIIKKSLYFTNEIK